MTTDIKKFIIGGDSSIKGAMKQLSVAGEKELFVVNEANQLIGALSDGDIRRWILKGGGLEDSISKIYNANPKFILENENSDIAKDMMIDLRIESVPVLNEKKEIAQVYSWDEIFGDKPQKRKEKLNIPVVVMAGGKGSRLDPYTRILPKPLIPIGEKPIIELILERFKEFNADEFFISVNHKSRMIKSYFEEVGEGFNIKFIEETQALGTAGSLKFLDVTDEREVLVTNCDVIIDTDYLDLLKHHKEKAHDITLVTACHHYQIPYGVCEIENGGDLKALREKPEYDLLVNVGMYVVNRNVIELIPRDKEFHFTDLIAAARQKGLKVGVYPINEKDWLDVGQWEEYRKSIKKMNIEMD